VREKKKGKIIYKKEFHETVVAGRVVVCDPSTSKQAQFVARLKSRSTYNPHQPKRVLPERRKEKKENEFTKKNLPRLLLLAESSFAIDPQQGKRSSLRD
jgi:hypothetical protein